MSRATGKSIEKTNTNDRNPDDTNCRMYQHTNPIKGQATELTTMARLALLMSLFESSKVPLYVDTVVLVGFDASWWLSLQYFSARIQWTNV
jgi:hypothetical protein